MPRVAGQEGAARDREARILYLEQLAAAINASNAALRAELPDAGQRREELELRVARQEVAAREVEAHIIYLMRLGLGPPSSSLLFSVDHQAAVAASRPELG